MTTIEPCVLFEPCGRPFNRAEHPATAAIHSGNTMEEAERRVYLCIKSSGYKGDVILYKQFEAGHSYNNAGMMQPRHLWKASEVIGEDVTGNPDEELVIDDDSNFIAADEYLREYVSEKKHELINGWFQHAVEEHRLEYNEYLDDLL